MDKLEGYKTIIVAAVVLLAAILQMFGIVIDQDSQGAIGTAAAAILMFVLRLVTTGPVKFPGVGGKTNDGG